eukprot:3353271-Prymnesium_polylepis.1
MPVLLATAACNQQPDLSNAAKSCAVLLAHAPLSSTLLDGLMPQVARASRPRVCAAGAAGGRPCCPCRPCRHCRLCHPCCAEDGAGAAGVLRVRGGCGGCRRIAGAARACRAGPVRQALAGGGAA